MNVSGGAHKSALSRLPSVRQMRALVAVHHLGSVSAAADDLSITQPAVTVLLRELEACLGVKLFDRSERRLRITDAGREAVEHSQEVLGQLGRMRDRMTELAIGNSGKVRVAATVAIAQTILPRAMLYMQAESPGVHVVVTEVEPQAFAEALLTHRADFGVGTLEAPMPGLLEECFVTDKLVAVAPAGSEHEGTMPMSWRELAGRPLIVVNRGYGIRQTIDQAATRAGIVLQIAHEVAHLGTALAWTAHGLGTTVVPASCVQPAPNAQHLMARPLIEPVAMRSVAIVRPEDRELSPAAQACIAAVRLSAYGPLIA